MSTIYDQVHGYIDISEFQNIIDTPEFQRLRNIKQLGACNYVFPSATGTRFEHSIGVYYLTDRILKAILKNAPESGLFRHSSIDKDKYCLIRLAALIHDMGHGPFSHLWDDLCIKNGNHQDHEFRGIEIFKWMNSKYSLKYSHDDIEFLSELVNPDIMNHPHKHHDCWMYQIVANKESGLDTDKMDYLIRDSRVVGLDINKEDIYRVIDSATIVDNVICFPRKKFYSRTIFNLFETRFKLHNALYQHPTVRGIELQIMDALNMNDSVLDILKSKNFQNVIEIFCSIDDSIIEKIQYMKKPGHKLITALKNRELYSLKGNYNVTDSEIEVPKGWILDAVKMSYNSEGTNPMKKVLFYREGGLTSCANPESYIEPRSYCQKFYRLYKPL